MAVWVREQRSRNDGASIEQMGKADMGQRGNVEVT